MSFCRYYWHIELFLKKATKSKVMSKFLLFQTVTLSVANRIVLINFYLDFIFCGL